MSKIFDAVTAVLLHDGEILINRRQRHLKAFPGYHAFPGGKVERDESSEPLPPSPLSALDARLMRALDRELREEIGFDLIAGAAAGEVLEIVPLGIALTPPLMPVRFNTHFFRVTLRSRPALQADPGEVEEMEWVAPAELAQRYRRGELLCAPPSIATIQALAENPQRADIPGLHFETRELTELPMTETVCGVRQIWVRSNTILPATHTNCFLLGDFMTHRILVDPSPNTEDEFERLCAMAKRLVVHEVFLTHHHPDHRERANELARRLEIPMGMSADTQARLFQKSKGTFFDGVSAVHIYREGDTVCRWNGEPVRVHEVPGHDEGQLALMPEGCAWCIVSDLIQGVGTVVIGKPEGNMRKYFASLRRVIELGPRVIYPSHGGALGSTHYLEETLRHRELRERQIVDFLAAGKTPDEMLPLIYSQIDPRLLPLARMNIESHLDKLREEGRLSA